MQNRQTGKLTNCHCDSFVCPYPTAEAQIYCFIAGIDQSKVMIVVSVSFSNLFGEGGRSSIGFVSKLRAKDAYLEVGNPDVD